MVHRDGSGGTLIVDLWLGKLGRLKRASGTADATVYRDVVMTLRRLRRDGAWDLLALVYNRLVTPLELCQSVWQQRTDELPSAEDARPLTTVIAHWTASLDRVPRTVADYRQMLLRLTTADARLSDLPTLLARARAQAMHTGRRSTFNHLWSAARTMLLHELGPEHRLTKAVRRIEALRVDRRKGNPQSPNQVRAIAGQMGRHAPALWALCLTGMRRGEYFNRRFTVLPDRVAIRGTKTATAVREIPKAYPVSAPTCRFRAFGRHLAEASGETVRIHDLRYTWMRWCEEAGIPEVRIRWYAGHAVKDVSELYRRGRGFTEHLVQDAERLRTWLGEPPSLQLEVAK